VFCSTSYHAGLNTDKRLFCIVVAYAHMELLANEQSPLVPSQLHGCIENSEKICSSAFYFEPTVCISKNIKNIAITTHLKRYQGRFCHYDWDFYRPRNFSERSRNLSRGCFLGKARLFSGQGKERSRGEIVIVLDRDRSCARRSRAHHAREIAPDVATGRART
jgi:hypothetical protein